MNIIVVVDKNWAIGNKNELLYHLPSDLKHFKKMTRDKTVIMGRKTLASLPGGKPLPNRLNVVLSKTLIQYPRKDGVTVVNSIADLFNLPQEFDIENAFIIGGQTIYQQLLSHAKYAYITKIDRAFEADAYFPNIDIDNNWLLPEELFSFSENNVKATVLKYENSNPTSCEVQKLADCPSV